MSTWKICDDMEGREIGYRAIVDAEGYTVCNPSPMGEDYANLIAAAPDLFNALVALSNLQVKGHALIDRLQFSAEGRAVLEKVNNALQSARGF